MKVFVMAGAGNQGRLIIPQLKKAGFTVRSARQTAGNDDELVLLGVDEILHGDACDPDFVRRAYDGVDGVYFLTPTAHPREREMGWLAIQAARDAGVGHFVYSSVLHPIASPMLQHKAKRDIEERLLEANIKFTIVQPADYMMENTIVDALSGNVWRQLYDLDRVQAMVALTDVADAVAKIFIEREKHFGATYEFCAPGNFSGNDIARIISEVSGKDIGSEIITPDQYFEIFYGIGEDDKFRYARALIRSVALWMGQYDFAGNSNVLGWILERPPVTLEGFVRNIVERDALK